MVEGGGQFVSEADMIDAYIFWPQINTTDAGYAD
jgi:hypothetical protein